MATSNNGGRRAARASPCASGSPFKAPQLAIAVVSSRVTLLQHPPVYLVRAAAVTPSTRRCPTVCSEQWQHVWRKSTGDRRRRAGGSGCAVAEVPRSDLLFCLPLLLHLGPGQALHKRRSRAPGACPVPRLCSLCQGAGVRHRVAGHCRGGRRQEEGEGAGDVSKCSGARRRRPERRCGDLGEQAHSD